MSIREDIQTRDYGFCFRKAVPVDIRPYVGGRREIVRSLGKDATRAKVQGRELSLQVERLFLTVRDGKVVDVKAALAALSTKKAPKKFQPASESPPTGSGGLIVSAALDAYQNERRLPPKTMIEYRAAVRRFVDVVGDKPIGAITKADARAFKDILLKLPKTPPRKLRKASVSKIVSAIGDDPTVMKISPKTVQKALGALSAILGWAESNGMLDANPFAKVKVAIGSQTAPGRIPYSTSDLKAIFSSPIFTGCFSKDVRSKPGNLIIRDHSFWLPLLGLYSGCRLEEMCQALLTDVHEERQITYLDINTLDDGKHLKTAGSVRRVPIHPRLIRLGFLEYVASLRGVGETQLFPRLRRDNRGSMSAMWSKFWGRYARKTIGITDPRKVFHSFRHSFKDACRAAEISEEVHDALTGHSNGSVGRGYGAGVPLSVLSDAIGRVEFHYESNQLK